MRNWKGFTIFEKFWSFFKIGIFVGVVGKKKEMEHVAICASAKFWKFKSADHYEKKTPPRGGAFYTFRCGNVDSSDEGYDKITDGAENTQKADDRR